MSALSYNPQTKQMGGWLGNWATSDKDGNGQTAWNEFWNGKKPEAVGFTPYSNPEYEGLEKQALAYLQSIQNFNSGADQAAQGMYDSGKAALDEELKTQNKALEEDSARRGIYNSGILTENKMDANKQYNRNLMDLSNQRAQYLQQMKMQEQAARAQAAQQILGYRPLSYQNWAMQNQVGMYNNQQMNQWQTTRNSPLDNILGILAVGMGAKNAYGK